MFGRRMVVEGITPLTLSAALAMTAIAVAIQRVDKGGELVGEATGGSDIAAIECLDKLLHGVGGDVGNHRNDADGTDGEERQEQAVIAGIPGEAGALLLLHCGCKIAGGVLDSP